MLLLIAGLYFPIPAAAMGLGITVSRFVYAWGYTYAGPGGRAAGVLVNDLLVLGLFVLSIITSVYFIQGKELVPK